MTCDCPKAPIHEQTCLLHPGNTLRITKAEATPGPGDDAMTESIHHGYDAGIRLEGAAGESRVPPAGYTADTDIIRRDARESYEGWRQAQVLNLCNEIDILRQELEKVESSSEAKGSRSPWSRCPNCGVIHPASEPCDEPGADAFRFPEIRCERVHQAHDGHLWLATYSNNVGAIGSTVVTYWCPGIPLSDDDTGADHHARPTATHVTGGVDMSKLVVAASAVVVGEDGHYERVDLLERTKAAEAVMDRIEKNLSRFEKARELLNPSHEGPHQILPPRKPVPFAGDPCICGHRRNRHHKEGFQGCWECDCISFARDHTVRPADDVSAEWEEGFHRRMDERTAGIKSSDADVKFCGTHHFHAAHTWRYAWPGLKADKARCPGVGVLPVAPSACPDAPMAAGRLRRMRMDLAVDSMKWASPQECKPHGKLATMEAYLHECLDALEEAAGVTEGDGS